MTYYFLPQMFVLTSFFKMCFELRVTEDLETRIKDPKNAKTASLQRREEKAENKRRHAAPLSFRP